VHTASITDVLTIYVGALAGAYLVHRNQIFHAREEARGAGA
jgi:hypothetical protein